MIYGLDIGGTKIEIAIFDEDVNYKESWRIKTPITSYKDFTEAIANMISEADKKYNNKGNIGIGMAGLNDQDGKSLSANIKVVNGKNIAKDLETLLSRPVILENDCRCFALSEAIEGAGAGFKSVYGAILGTGAAGGYVVNGTLVTGRLKIAGEYGHVQLPAILKEKYNLPLRECGCGLPSCYEGYISGPGMEFLHLHMSGENIDVLEIMKRFREKDKNASDTIKCYLDILGSCFSNIIINHDPHAIILGGGISLINEIRENLPEYINRHLFKGYRSPPIINAKFGDASGARGAALLAKEHYNA